MGHDAVTLSSSTMGSQLGSTYCMWGQVACGGIALAVPLRAAVLLCHLCGSLFSWWRPSFVATRQSTGAAAPWVWRVRSVRSGPGRWYRFTQLIGLGQHNLLVASARSLGDGCSTDARRERRRFACGSDLSK